MTTTTTTPGSDSGSGGASCAGCGSSSKPHDPRCDAQPVPGTGKTVGEIKGLGA
jgi:hypothetical protein